MKGVPAWVTGWKARAILAAAVILPAAAGLALLLLLRQLDQPVAVPSFQEVRERHASSELRILDRHGAVIHEIRVDPEGRRLDWTPLADVSPPLPAACIAAEDRRFYRHEGVDWAALGSALLQTAAGRGSRGASTISMQLASLLEERLQPRGTRRSISQKWRQMRHARALERSWSKEQILEAYLNLVSFRGELQGTAAASRGLFGKEPHGLNVAESAILAALIRSPGAAADEVLRRAERLAERAGLQTSPAGLQSAASQALGGGYTIRHRRELAWHVAQRLSGGFQPGRGGANLASTIEGPLQEFALETLQQHLRRLHSSRVQDGALLVADNRSGEILAYVGNGGDLSSARYVDGVQALRQAGSTLKPFLYGLGFERRLLTPASILDDSPLEIPVTGGVYRPSNYDNLFHGPVPARVALASSLNVPAVRLLAMTGIEEFGRRLDGLGFRDLREPEFYGPSLALGSLDVSLWDLVQAYRTLPNQGLWSPLRLEPGPSVPERRVYPAEAAFLVSMILSDRESRSLTFGLESPLATRFWTAVKTGTSKDMRDNWCVGYSSDYTVGVWVGNFSGEPMRNVSGMSGAAPLWVDLMEYLHRNRPSPPPLPPRGVSRSRVFSQLEGQEQEEWFMEGTAVSRIRLVAQSPSHRIDYPTEGSIISLDPDIPEGLERVVFETRSGLAELSWILDGVEVGANTRLLPWTPTPGPHLLVLRSGERVLDQVSFSVRGGPAEPVTGEVLAIESSPPRLSLP